MIDYKIPIRSKKKKKGDTLGLQVAGVLFVIVLVVIGVAMAWKKGADWGAGHQLKGQSIIKQALQFQLPLRVEVIEPEIVQEIVVTPEYSSLTSTEQKVIDKWGYKNGIVAMAIFDCGESRMDQYAVSLTGDLGIAQINWHYNGKIIQDRFGYTSADMLTSIDANLDAAYLIWDRADGEEGDGEGSWGAWSGFNNGSYTNCFNR